MELKVDIEFLANLIGFQKSFFTGFHEKEGQNATPIDLSIKQFHA